MNVRTPCFHACWDHLEEPLLRQQLCQNACLTPRRSRFRRPSRVRSINQFPSNANPSPLAIPVFPPILPSSARFAASHPVEATFPTREMQEINGLRHFVPVGRSSRMPRRPGVGAEPKPAPHPMPRAFVSQAAPSGIPHAGRHPAPPLFQFRTQFYPEGLYSGHSNSGTNLAAPCEP